MILYSQKKRIFEKNDQRKEMKTTVVNPQTWKKMNDYYPYMSYINEIPPLANIELFWMLGNVWKKEDNEFLCFWVHHSWVHEEEKSRENLIFDSKTLNE